MEKNLISIIVPIYNAEKFIKETIETVLNQTINNFELILVDDISTDNSSKIIKEYTKKDSRIKYVKLEKKGLASGARNRGVLEAKGEFVCFLDADDLWSKDKLEKQLLFMKKNNCAFSFTGYEFANNQGIPNGKKVIVPFKINYKQALKNTTIFTSTVMFDMKKIKKEDIYMPNIKSEDTATWWKILKKGYIAYGLNEVLTLYRRSEGTLSSNKIEAIKRIWYLYRKQEKLNLFSAIYNFMFYLKNAIKRRI